MKNLESNMCLILASTWIFIQNTASESKSAADHNFTWRKFQGGVIEYVNTHDETKIVRRYIHPRPYANPTAKPQDSA